MILLTLLVRVKSKQAASSATRLHTPLSCTVQLPAYCNLDYGSLLDDYDKLPDYYILSL